MINVGRVVNMYKHIKLACRPVSDEFPFKFEYGTGNCSKDVDEYLYTTKDLGFNLLGRHKNFPSMISSVIELFIINEDIAHDCYQVDTTIDYAIDAIFASSRYGNEIYCRNDVKTISDRLFKLIEN